MKAPSMFSLLVGFPSSILLIYLALHATEGWQLLVVCTFFGCFLASWLMRSKFALAGSYAMTVALAGWVAWVNL
jgi:hypothetical protein